MWSVSAFGALLSSTRSFHQPRSGPEMLLQFCVATPMWPSCFSAVFHTSVASGRQVAMPMSQDSHLPVCPLNWNDAVIRVQFWEGRRHHGHRGRGVRQHCPGQGPMQTPVRASNPVPPMPGRDFWQRYRVTVPGLHPPYRSSRRYMLMSRRHCQIRH